MIPIEESFALMEAQVLHIKHNMNLLMEAMTYKLKLFKEYGVCNVEGRSKGILGY